MAEKVGAVIVGGGVVGCATAYFLARNGMRPVLFEREAVGSCASGFAAGLLNPLNGHGIPGPLEALAQESFRLHARLADQLGEETGIDPQVRTLSCIWTAFNEEEAQELQQLFQLAQRLDGFRAEWLDGREVRQLEPRVSQRVTKAMYVEGTRQVASYEYTLALAQAAEKHGAIIRQGTVEGLIRTNGAVSGVALQGEQIACDKLVLAMGPWTGQAERWLGIPVPVSPLKGQILRLELAGPRLEYAFYRSGGGYISPKPDGLIWTGTTEERVGFDDRPTLEARKAIMKGALEVLPALSDARLALQTACLRPLSEDGMPIIGEVPGWDGVYIATGAGRKGILLGPAMALAVADLVTAGRTELPIQAFSPARFSASA